MFDFKTEGPIPLHSEARPRRDTIIKPSIVIESTLEKTKAKSVALMVKDDLAGNCHLADTDAFLKAILLLPTTSVKKIYKRLEAERIYTSGLWKLFSSGSKKEVAFYAPFVNIANRINEACAAEILGVQLKTYWLDQHSTSPQSRDKDAASIRPDIVSVLGTGEGLDKWEENIINLKERIGEPVKTEAEAIKGKVQLWFTRHHLQLIYSALYQEAADIGDEKLEDVKEKVWFCWLQLVLAAHAHCVTPETDGKRGRGIERNQRKGAVLLYATQLCSSHVPSHYQIKDLAKLLLDVWWL